MNTNNAITIATIESVMRAIITAEGGEQLIVCPPETLAQMNEITSAIATAAGYDESKLTEEDFELASVFAKSFTKECLTGVVVDGQLQPMPPEEMATFYTEHLPLITHEYPAGSVLATNLIAKIMNEVKQFTR